MYFLSSSLLRVKGIGAKTADKLLQHNLKTVQDLLLFLPLNYSDLSQVATIDQLKPEQSYTVKARVVAVNTYYKNRKKLTKAVITDHTGRTQCLWFNSSFIKQQLKIDQVYFFAGQYSRYHTFTQPKVEAVKTETLHTGRLVPRYTQTLGINQGKMRLILKEILSNLKIEDDILGQKFNLLELKKTLTQLHFPDDKKLVVEARKRLAVEELLALIKQSHKSKLSWQKRQPLKKLQLNTTLQKKIIPDFLLFKLTNDQLKAVNAIIENMSRSYPMNRLLIGDVGSGKTVVAGIASYHMIKAGFNCALVAPTQILAEQHLQTFTKIFPELPTKLLTAKTKQREKVVEDKNKPSLFIGTHAVINQLSTINPALVIFDEQHRFGVAQRAQALQVKTTDHLQKQPGLKKQPGLQTQLGTQTQLDTQTQPSSLTQSSSLKQPHILTMSATPIPRSYMLTIFSHLEVSLIKQFPFGEKNIKTFLVPKAKKQQAFDWMSKQLKASEATKTLTLQKKTLTQQAEVPTQEKKSSVLQGKAVTQEKKTPAQQGEAVAQQKKTPAQQKEAVTQEKKTPTQQGEFSKKPATNNQVPDLKPLAIIVCPFIDPSENENFGNVPAATEVFQKMTAERGQELSIALLHGRQKPTVQEKIIQQLFNQEIDLLITTSIVEVGVDLPQASIMMIEGADRFGLASLHQLRGRVGRQSQESYCLLSSSSQGAETTRRLKLFSQENDGLKLAELDLQTRGPGDLFGLKQHGLDNLMFADWHNLELINQAQEIFAKLEQTGDSWEPILKIEA